MRETKSRIEQDLSGHDTLPGFSLFLALSVMALSNAIELEEVCMLKVLFAAVASIAMVGGAIAADLPRKEPPPVVAAPVGKAPIGKLPFGKGPVVARY
jgi:hypothetical protein